MRDLRLSLRIRHKLSPKGMHKVAVSNARARPTDRAHGEGRPWSGRIQRASPQRMQPVSRRVGARAIYAYPPRHVGTLQVCTSFVEMGGETVGEAKPP